MNYEEAKQKITDAFNGGGMGSLTSEEVEQMLISFFYQAPSTLGIEGLEQAMDPKTKRQISDINRDKINPKPMLINRDSTTIKTFDAAPPQDIDLSRMYKEPQMPDASEG